MLPSRRVIRYFHCGRHESTYIFLDFCPCFSQWLLDYFFSDDTLVKCVEIFSDINPLGKWSVYGNLHSKVEHWSDTIHSHLMLF